MLNKTVSLFKQHFSSVSEGMAHYDNKKQKADHYQVQGSGDHHLEVHKTPRNIVCLKEQLNTGSLFYPTTNVHQFPPLHYKPEFSTSAEDFPNFSYHNILYEGNKMTC
jgi:hypothetical protein